MFAKLIIDLRKETGLTQTEFAKRIGLPQMAISRWERRVAGSNTRVINRIGREFNLSKKQVFNLDNANQTMKEGKIEKLEGYHYELIERIEQKHGSLTKCPNDDPILQVLHKSLGVKKK